MGLAGAGLGSWQAGLPVHVQVGAQRPDRKEDVCGRDIQDQSQHPRDRSEGMGAVKGLRKLRGGGNGDIMPPASCMEPRETKAGEN